jgi:hypothetical protein
MQHTFPVDLTLHGVQGVGGSNPLAPTNKHKAFEPIAVHKRRLYIRHFLISACVFLSACGDSPPDATPQNQNDFRTASPVQVAVSPSH